jgi:hypothetical protein
MECETVDALENEIFVPSGMYESDEHRVARLRSACEMAKRLLKKESGNDRLLTLLGIAMYFLSKDISVPAAEINRPLEEAIALNPTNSESVLYLGYSHFDASRYDQSLIALSTFRSSSAYKSAFSWLQLKVDELVLAAKVHLEPASVSCKEVIDLNSKRLQCESVDRPVALEILSALGFSSDSESRKA